MVQADIQLSQCMIVKNEEKNIEQALSWGKGIVCEQIVVDTGSTDRTVELAEKMGAKVFHFTWIDDFSAAKNYAIEQATGNWIAFLDADESFSKEDAKKLLEILEDFDGNKKVAFIRAKIVHLNGNGEVLAASCQDRIFRNAPDIRYQYRIHEQIHCTSEERKFSYLDAQDRLMIRHTGYGEQVDRPGKGARNTRMLERELEENPESGLLNMYLGDSYSMENRNAEALDCYRKVLWNDAIDTSDGISALRSALQILRIRVGEPALDSEEELFKTAKKLRELGYVSHPDIDYCMGGWHLKAGHMEKAAALFESALEKLEWYQGPEVAEMTSRLEIANRVIAIVAFNKGDLQKAVRFAVPALRIEPYTSDAIKALLGAFRMEWKEGKSVEPYWNFLGQLYDMKNSRDLLVLYKAAAEVRFYKLMERIWEALPGEVKEQVKGSNHDKQ